MLLERLCELRWRLHTTTSCSSVLARASAGNFWLEAPFRAVRSARRPLPLPPTPDRVTGALALDADRDGQPGPPPFWEPVCEAPGPEPFAEELADGLVGVGAVRPTAVGDYL